MKAPKNPVLNTVSAPSPVSAAWAALIAHVYLGIVEALLVILVVGVEGPAVVADGAAGAEAATQSVHDVLADDGAPFLRHPRDDGGVEVGDKAFKGEGAVFDFPHWDSKFPVSIEKFLELPITDEDKRKILWDNCADYYGIG